MRILYLADIRFPLERANGIQTFATCHALAEQGHDVTLLVRPDTQRPPRDPFAFYGLAPTERLHVTRVTTSLRGHAARAAYLAGAVRRAITDRPDVVLTRDLGTASLLLRLPAALRPPVAYESHGFAPSVALAMPEMVSGAPAGSARKRRRLEAREAHVWRRAEAYVTITDGLAAELEHRFGSRARRVTIPDGCRLPADRRFEAPRRRLTPVVAYAGHLYPWKGVDVLLEALHRLPSVRGLIVGGHPDEPDLDRTRSRATDLGLDDRVDLAGQVAPGDVAGRLAEADVLALPNPRTAISERYTSPLKLFEYLAQGKPIVASRLPSLEEVLRDGENAILVEPGDPDALAAGIRTVVEHPDVAERVARRAFETAERYTWSARATRLAELLRAVLDETR